MIHPKKGSPSGRNAYPVTEKMEELKEEEKNDMAKKKTFQEYTQEADGATIDVNSCVNNRIKENIGKKTLWHWQSLQIPLSAANVRVIMNR